jgi:hypothetical protein
MRASYCVCEYGQESFWEGKGGRENKPLSRYGYACLDVQTHESRLSSGEGCCRLSSRKAASCGAIARPTMAGWRVRNCNSGRAKPTEHQQPVAKGNKLAISTTHERGTHWRSVPHTKEEHADDQHHTRKRNTLTISTTDDREPWAYHVCLKVMLGVRVENDRKATQGGGPDRAKDRHVPRGELVTHG